MCNRPAERVGLHVVGEAPPAVDLDDRQPLPVFGLEGGVAGDVDLAQVEAELLAELATTPRAFSQRWQPAAW